LDEQTRRLLQEQLLLLWERQRKTVVFITHSMDEAVMLGDRVMLMSPRPGRVKEMIEVPLPRPRRGVQRPCPLVISGNRAPCRRAEA
jgi:ABC-type nitrate/sulfonate/bicarbonate transport system ATPase subunit